MPVTREEFEEICLATCPRCAGGHKPTQRLSTGEWQHSVSIGSTMAVSLCFASGFRNSRFAPKLENPVSG